MSQPSRDFPVAAEPHEPRGLVTNVAGAQSSSNALLSLIASVPPQLEITGPVSNSSVQLTALVEVGATYALETSTNLVGWITVTNQVANSTLLNLSAPASPGDSQRFYRLRSGP